MGYGLWYNEIFMWNPTVRMSHNVNVYSKWSSVSYGVTNISDISQENKDGIDKDGHYFMTFFCIPTKTLFILYIKSYRWNRMNC